MKRNARVEVAPTHGAAVSKADEPALPEDEQNIFEAKPIPAVGILAVRLAGLSGGVLGKPMALASARSAEKAIRGVWLYGGRCGVMMRQGEEGVMRVRFEDSASQNPELPEGENCVFGADGELLFAGSMTGEQRCGFGVAKWGAQGHRYVGAWNEDKPQGGECSLSRTVFCLGRMAGWNAGRLRHRI